MATTIQVSEGLKEALNQRKLYENETYEEVIMNLLEDASELSKETKKLLRQAEADVKAGRVRSFEDVKRELGV